VTIPATRRTDLTSKQYGFYVQDEIRFGGFIATLASRLDQADSDTLTTTGLTKKRDHAITSRAALLYRFDNGIAPYISYAESFTPLTGTDAAGRVFDPEQGTQYEAGIKYQPVGINALLTAAVFDLTRNNLLTTDLANRNYSVQVGQARSRGFELEAKASLNAGLNLTASYTYLDTKYTRDNSGLLGLVPVGVPGQMASLWGYYTLPPDIAPGLSLGGGVRYIGTNYNTNNTLVVPAVTLFDAALNYDLGSRVSQFKGTTLSINAKNLFDTEYVGACYTSTTCAYGWGRVVTAGLQYRW
jgi:iron complex outermembrane recepter protein